MYQFFNLFYLNKAIENISNLIYVNLFLYLFINLFAYPYANSTLLISVIEQMLKFSGKILQIYSS